MRDNGRRSGRIVSPARQSAPVAIPRLDDLRLFAAVAESKSFTAAARVLGMPKQTLSRRIAELEAALDAQLLHRTTRRLHLTDQGAALAERAIEVARLADDAVRALSDDRAEPRGLLRISADPVFGEHFVTELVIEHARRWPAVAIEVVLSRRRVELAEEGFDLAFRIGQVDDAALRAIELGPADIRYCASPAYLRRRAAPRAPADLAAHDCIVLADGGGAPARWPFRGARGPTMLPVTARLTTSSLRMAHAAARAGLGIALFPAFACAEDVARRRLVPVLDAHVPQVGSVWLVHPAARRPPARVASFVALATERLGAAPWSPEPPEKGR